MEAGLLGLLPENQPLQISSVFIFVLLLMSLVLMNHAVSMHAHEFAPILHQVLFTYPKFGNFMNSSHPILILKHTMSCMFPFQPNLFFSLCLGWNPVVPPCLLLSCTTLRLHQRQMQPLFQNV
jgi:hypothetical protein